MESNYRDFQRFIVENPKTAHEVGAIAASNLIFRLQAETAALKDLNKGIDELLRAYRIGREPSNKAHDLIASARKRLDKLAATASHEVQSTKGDRNG